jgi:hypothetical protein
MHVDNSFQYVIIAPLAPPRGERFTTGGEADARRVFISITTLLDSTIDFPAIQGAITRQLSSLPHVRGPHRERGVPWIPLAD